MSADTKTKVIVVTDQYRIAGSIDLLPGARLTDLLAEAKEFIALTAAEVFDLNGRRLFSSEFLDVNRRCIEMIMPESAVTQGIWRQPLL